MMRHSIADEPAYFALTDENLEKTVTRKDATIKVYASMNKGDYWDEDELRETTDFWHLYVYEWADRTFRVALKHGRRKKIAFDSGGGHPSLIRALRSLRDEIDAENEDIEFPEFDFPTFRNRRFEDGWYILSFERFPDGVVQARLWESVDLGNMFFGLGKDENEAYEDMIRYAERNGVCPEWDHIL